MLGFGNLSTALGAKALSAVTLAQAQAEPAATAAAATAATAARPETTSLVHPALVVVLCAAAAAGTVMLLPGRKESAWGKIGGIVIAAAAAVLMFVLINVVADAGFERGLGVYFWVFSILALFGALRVITHTQPVYSALYFVLTVLASAGLFVLLWAEFMAAALVIIYAGAILVTYVFVIMLASEAAPPRPTAAGTHDSGAIEGLAEHDRISREPIAASAVGFTLLAVLLVVILDTRAVMPPFALVAENLPDSTQPVPAAIAAAGPTQALGAYLFENHLVSLELAGLILTLAMVGAIIIARRRVLGPAPVTERTAETIVGPATPVDDNPHSVPVYGTDNPRQKAYPET